MATLAAVLNCVTSASDRVCVSIYTYICVCVAGVCAGHKNYTLCPLFQSFFLLLMILISPSRVSPKKMLEINHSKTSIMYDE